MELRHQHYLDRSIHQCITQLELQSDARFKLYFIEFNFNDGVIGGVSPQGQPGLASPFTERFKFIWIPSERATLNIFNVTTVENGTFSCVVTAFDNANFASKTWTSKVQVKVFGKQ